MKTFTHKSLFVAMIFIFSTNIFGQQINNGIKTTVLSSTNQSTTIEYVLANYDVRNIDINGTEYSYYDIPGSIWLMVKGLPQLPTNRQSIIIPDQAATNYSVISAEYKLIETFPVMPSKGHMTRNIDSALIPYEFDEFYFTNDWFPKENIHLDVPYIVRDLRGQTIQFNPMQYNPAEGKLKICTKIIIEVYSDYSIQPVNPFIRTIPLDRVSGEFDDIYKTLFINYGRGVYDYVPLDETGRLLIIYPSAFASNITPFYNWKMERGISTLLAEYPAQTGSGSGAIKSYIQNLYNSAEGLTFIILVGESNQIPTLNGQHENAPSDPSYVKLAGNDAYPDAFISRISPTSSSNLDYIFWKLIRYEKYPDTGPDAEWYLKAVGVASNDQGGTGIPDWQRANLLRDMIINNMNFTHVDQIYDPGATSSQVINAINNGRSILNYIGHGSGTSWGTTGFGNSHIHALSNGYKNPFIIDVACTNGNFTMTECMEEAWIRAGDMQNPKGAIAAYGASTLASWVPPCDMQKHAIELLTTRQKQSIGGVCFNGLMYAMDLWGGSSGEGLKLMEQYNIFGDCTMLLTLGAEPDTIAPEQITDLIASDQTSNSVILNWTSPFDSTFLGVVSYDLRFSTTPIITNNDFDNAPQIIIPGEPDTAGMLKSYNLKNLESGTIYYFAIKAADLWGNKSVMSNVISETTWGAPAIVVNPDSMHCIIEPDTLETETITISNASTHNSTLDYSIELTNNTFPEDVKVIINPTIIERGINNSKDRKDEDFGLSFRGSGGPDAFGYKWIDSDAPGGPQYVWEDISSTGTPVTNWIATGTFDPKDEGYAGPLPLGFNFKFYGNSKTQVYVSSNGFLHFSTLTTNTYTNTIIPNNASPNEIIAPFWDDLDGRTQGTVHYKQDGNRFIIQYTNWQKYSGTGSLTFQVVLYSSGKIIVYYNNMNATLNSATIGIEDNTGTIGLQVAYNSAYVQNNMALQFSAEPDWLGATPLSGTIYNGNSVDLILQMNTDDLELGEYSMDIEITTNDPLNSFIVVPVRMTVTIVPVELACLSADYINGEVLLSWQTASETNNLGFEIERKTGNDKTSESNQEIIGFIEGKGTTTGNNIYSFTDKNLKPGIYNYRLKQIDFDGTINYSNFIEVEVYAPDKFMLEQNYPNPFNPSTIIRYHLPVESKVTISIYNILGKEIATIVNEIKEAGIHQVEFTSNGEFSSGVYFYSINAGNFTSVKKFLLVK